MVSVPLPISGSVTLTAFSSPQEKAREPPAPTLCEAGTKIVGAAGDPVPPAALTSIV